MTAVQAPVRIDSVTPMGDQPDVMKELRAGLENALGTLPLPAFDAA
jgi:hypothetical protein